MRQIFFDTETTGLMPEGGDRLVEIGCVEMVNRQLTGNNLHLYINPERDMPEEAERIHGLSAKFLSDKPKFAEVVDQFLEFVSGAELVIHNAAFDLSFCNAELKRLKKPPITDCVTVRDTLLMAREMFPGKANSLDALCRRLEVDNSGRKYHGALLDAELLADVYINMTRGQDSLLGGDDAGEGSAPQDGEIRVAAVDLRSYVLPVLQATAVELAAHEKVLGELDKASGGKRIWVDQPQLS